MYNELYQIFILDKELKIPGIGNFILTRKPAEANFLEKAINPPVYSISLDKETGVPVKSFYSGLAGLLHTDDKEATTRFNDFVSDLKQKFMAGKKIEWPGIGILTAGSKGTITFQPFGVVSIEEPVKAEKVIRDHAEHTVLVGGQERSSAEMTELLSSRDSKKSKWWVLALIAGILIIVFTYLHFSKNGWDTSSLSNRESISVETPSSTYTINQ